MALIKTALAHELSSFDKNLNDEDYMTEMTLSLADKEDFLLTSFREAHFGPGCSQSHQRLVHVHQCRLLNLIQFQSPTAACYASLRLSFN